MLFLLGFFILNPWVCSIPHTPAGWACKGVVVQLVGEKTILATHALIEGYPFQHLSCFTELCVSAYFPCLLDLSRPRLLLSDPFHTISPSFHHSFRDPPPDMGYARVWLVPRLSQPNQPSRTLGISTPHAGMFSRSLAINSFRASSTRPTIMA